MLRNNMTRPQISKLTAIILIGGALLAGTFYAGLRYGYAQKKVAYIEEALNTEPPEGVSADFSILWEAWNLIKDLHISGSEIDSQQLLYGTISGLVQSLDDPYSVFLSPEDSKKFDEDIRGKFGGVGMEIGIRKNQLVVIAPLKNTPAERAGLKSGDKILKVGDEFTDGITITEAVQIIRGDPGDVVVLTVFRDGWDETREISITREIIEIPTLDYETIDDGIMHIKLYSFNENAPRKFYEAAVSALSENTKGIILDLRNNPGGFLEVAVNIAGWFVEGNTVVVSERFTSGEERDFKTQHNGALKDIPVIVLVNGGSASASEILAGALQDIRNAKLVGEKTYGKGSVQELKTLDDGSTLKLTIARWLLPNGTIIEENGIEPDISIVITEEDTENERDPQLERALATLRGELAQK